MKSLIRALSYLKRYGLLALAAYLSLTFSTGIMLISPKLIQSIIDQGITARDVRVVLQLSFALVLLAIVRAAFSFLQGYFSEKASQSVAYSIRNALYAKIQSLSFSYHDRAQTGQLMTRATNDVEIVRRFTGIGFLMFINAVITLLGSLILLFTTNGRLAGTLLILIPATLAIFGLIAGRARPLFTVIQERLAALNTVLQENLAGVRVVKAFAQESRELARFGVRNRELLDVQLRVGKLLAIGFPLFFLVASLGTLLITWYGGFMVIDGEMTLGALVAFTSYVFLIMMPVGMMGMILSNISRAAASAERIFEILDAEIEIRDTPDAYLLPQIKGRVQFDNVTFRYFGSGEPVLQDVSFTAEPGQTVALLGATGSGKTTIINLIPRFYDVTDGAITIDGHDLRQITIVSLRQRIGIVLQETTLFSGTIRDNIAFGRPDATQAEIEAATRAAAAHDFITAFPDGYDTMVGERGVMLSGGQKQRIAIARALLMDPHILILDDSTSSVDVQTETQIQKALAELMKGRTSFVIAQRISTVQNADQILVLNKGKIAARGTHEELIENSPIYAEIYCSQLLPAG